jgi:hypothetical protein
LKIPRNLHGRGGFGLVLMATAAVTAAFFLATTAVAVLVSGPSKAPPARRNPPNEQARAACYPAPRRCKGFAGAPRLEGGIFPVIGVAR